ncbi:MAG: SRPBCC family protein [Aeromicrobium sp.]|uniref:SRPBCC family protein n=1 Tax=Aeromicrobium sp. TaxID=1871063 RepID=UPI0039E2E0A9
MSRGPVAPLAASVEIDATPAQVWRVVADQRRMNQWSPETHRQYFIGEPLRRGTLSVNVNKRKAVLWPTLSRYLTVEPEKKLEFHVVGPAAIWSYELTPLDDGARTKLTERRRLKNDRRTWLSLAVAGSLLGGVASHDDELVDGMKSTLARIKAEAEGASA